MKKIILVLSILSILYISAVSAAGDNCSDPIIINTFPYTDTNDTTSMNHDYNPTCAGDNDALDAVYSIIPSKSTTYFVNLTAGFDLVLYAATNCSDIAGTVLNCSDQPPYGYENITFTVGADETAYIIVDGYDIDDMGEYTLTVTDLSLSCGDTIASDTTLTSNLTDCSSNGLNIGADDVTLDCQGHTIDGTGSAGSIGVNNTAGYDNFSMRNCEVKEFDYGLKDGNVGPAGGFFSENGTIENNNFHDLSASNFHVLLVGSGNLYYNNTFSCSFYSLFSNGHVFNKTVQVNITDNDFSDILAIQESTYVNVKGNNIYSSALISGNHPAENQNNTLSYNITFDNNNFHGSDLDIKNMTNSTIVDNYNMSSITASQSDNIALNDNYVCSGESTITLTSNSHNNTGDNICNTLDDADSNSVTCSCSCSPEINYNASTASVDIGDDITIATNWTDGYLDSSNLTCQLYVDGSLNETINSTGSWCNFTYTTTSADYGTKSFYVTVVNNIGNSATSSTLTSTVNLACGSVITSDFTLDQDLNCGESDGLTIGADSITFDCDGYSINGTNGGGTESGIKSNGHDSLTITDCTVTGFDRGISLSNSEGHTIQNNVLGNNIGIAFSGVYLNTVNDSLIQSNNFYENDDGIHLVNSHHNTVTNNVIFNGTGYMMNDHYGIHLDSATGNTINSNTIKETTYGIYIESNSNDNLFDNNDVIFNEDGIVITESEGNNITNGLIKANSMTGIVLSNTVNTLIQDNTIKNNIAEALEPAEPECAVDSECSENLQIIDNTIFGNDPHGLHFNDGDCGSSQTIANNTMSIVLVSPEEGYTLNESNLNLTFIYDWTNFLPYDSAGGGQSFTGNCTLYIDGTVKNITSFTDKGTDDLGTTNTVENISIQYKTQTWYVSCEDDNGNTAESERKTLTTVSSQSQATNIPITTTANTETTVNQTALSDNNISANMSLMTSVSTTGTMTVSQYENNPAPSTSGFGSPIGLFMSFDLNMSGLDWAIIKMYYSNSDVSGLDENTLRISYYNATSGSWSSYDAPNGGVNTTANYIWANTTHFSIFGASGSSLSDSTPSGSSGGGTCIPAWECTEWSECINGQQIRECTDKWNCGKDYDKPAEIQDCEEEPEKPTTQETEPKTEDKKKESKEEYKGKEPKGKESNWTTYTIIIALLAATLAFIFFKRKN